MSDSDIDEALQHERERISASLLNAGLCVNPTTEKNMRIENIEATTFTIFDAPKLDPVIVILQDMGGQGRVIIECFGSAWSGYWGAIGSNSLKHFLIGCHPEYIAGKMEPSGRRLKKNEQAYLLRIVEAVHSALTHNA